jgi:hypothetical protein
MAPSFVESFNVAVAAALIMSEARQMRLREMGRCGDLDDKEIDILTAIMLLKHRGGNAVAWHEHWRRPADSPSDRYLTLCTA